MRLYIAILLVNVFFANQLFADPIELSSGEHQDFTRIVFNANTDQPWEIQEGNGQIVVDFPDHSDGFQIDEVFARIPRSRLQSLEASANSITIELGCDCEANSFKIDPDLFVLDISLRAEVIESSFGERELNSAEVRNQGQDMKWDTPLEFVDSIIGSTYDSNISVLKPDNLISSLRVADDSESHFALPILPEARSIQTIGLSGGEVRSLTMSLMEAEEVDPIGNGNRFEFNHLEIRDQLQVAINSGLLQLNDLGHSVNDSEISGSSEFDISEQNSTYASDYSSESERVSDRYSNEKSAQTYEGTSNFDCEVSEMLNVGLWGNWKNPISDIRNSQMEVFDSRDNINESAVIELARKYIYFGLIPEALNAIRLIDKDSPDARAIVLIERILSGFSDEDGHSFFQISQCENAAEPWAFLSAEVSAQRAELDIVGVLDALEKFPPNLRGIVAPQVSKKLLKLGYPDKARHALRLAKRADPILSADGRVQNALHKIDTDQNISGRTELAEVISDNSHETPAALIQYVEELYRERSVTSADFEVLLESMIKQYRGSDIEQDLHRSLSLTYALNGNFSNAMNLIEGHTKHRAGDMRTLHRVLGLLALNGSDIEFLRYALDEKFVEDLEQSKSIYDIVEERKADLGFHSFENSFDEEPRATEITNTRSGYEALNENQVGAKQGVTYSRADTRGNLSTQPVTNVDAGESQIEHSRRLVESSVDFLREIRTELFDD